MRCDSQVTLAVSSLAILVASGLYLWRRRCQKKWKLVGKVSQVYIYPLKSGKPLELEEVECTSIGPKETTKNSPLRDRFFVLYKEATKEFISGKTYPHILQVRVTRNQGGVRFSFPGEEDFLLTLPTEDKRLEIQLYRKEMLPAIDCGDDISRWISNAIIERPKGIRVGFWSDSIKQRRNAKDLHWYQFYKSLRDEDTGAYSDLSSYHLISKSSVDDTNQKIPSSEITPLHFRPNFIVEGPSPYEEDEWDWIKIGDRTEFRYFKPCTRCALVVLNPDTNLKEPNFEPITTMRSFRLVTDPKLKEVEKDSPVMGVYMGLHQKGRVKVGDPVYVTYKEKNT